MCTATLEMLMKLISDSQIKLEMVLAEGAKTAIKKCSICSKKVYAQLKKGMKKYSKTGWFTALELRAIENRL